VPDIAAVFCSPRRNGNTAALLQSAIDGARQAGAGVDEIILRDYRISPCLEIYGCKKDGECAIKDDFQDIRDRIMACKGLMIATPIFFYTVSAQAKILMDRCQSLWVKKYWINKTPYGKWIPARKGLVIAVGATKGKKLFDGMLLSLKYFFDVLDMELWDCLLFRGLDLEGDVLKHPAYLDQANRRGREFAEATFKPIRSQTG
jgi:multimeric flavodoxin WrbA